MSHVLAAVAWPYANGPRHIGHVSGFGVPSDVFSRYMRMAGHDVLMVSGTDEHGTPIQVQADADGVTARELADRYNRVIVEDLHGLGLSYDLFTRTTTGNHYAVVQEMFRTVHRNGYLGVAQWGGWVWSGDTQAAWKTLEGQVAVGINHSLSLSPYWGSDLGGFYTTDELTGELYARWFQFSAFTPSFRAHGRIWRLHLPWGWGLSDMGFHEGQKVVPPPSEMNNPAIEPIARKYDNLRYQLIPYIYTLSREAHDTGMPLMRALWLHYPDDERARAVGDEYLWGRDMLIAPVFTKGATEAINLVAQVWAAQFLKPGDVILLTGMILLLPAEWASNLRKAGQLARSALMRRSTCASRSATSSGATRSTARASCRRSVR